MYPSMNAEAQNDTCDHSNKKRRSSAVDQSNAVVCVEEGEREASKGNHIGNKRTKSLSVSSL